MGAIANHKAGHNLLVILKGVISLSDFGVVFRFGFQLVVGSAKKKACLSNPPLATAKKSNPNKCSFLLSLPAVALFLTSFCLGSLWGLLWRFAPPFLPNLSQPSHPSKCRTVANDEPSEQAGQAKHDENYMYNMYVYIYKHMCMCEEHGLNIQYNITYLKRGAH